MKLFCFVITLVLVNVLANNEADYNKQVVITNAAIELAYNVNDLFVGDNILANGLEYVIEKLVNDTPSYFHVRNYFKCFARINLMIAVPDMMELFFHILPGPEYLRNPSSQLQLLIPEFKFTMLKHIQKIMQLEIEHTINNVVQEAEAGQTDFGILNSLTTLAEKRRLHVESALKNIFRRKLGSLYDQFIFQLEIRDTLNEEGLNLSTMTEVRRVTGRPLENVIRHVLGTGTCEDDEDQRTGISNNDGNQNRPAHDESLYQMCCLMGLYLSTKFPTSYIIKFQIDPISYTCSLDDGIMQRRLKKINGVWWQISSTTSEVVLPI